MKYAIVTGASRGVGFSTSKKLLENGYKVIGTSRDINSLNNIKKLGVETFELDLTNFNTIKNFYEKYKNITLDLLVNNAGGGASPTNIINETPENFNYAYSLNVSGPMYLSKLFTNNLQKSDNPTIIFISSMGGKFTYPGGGNYTNAKRGVSGLVDTMRLEYPHYGIKITEICPGTIDTVDGEKREISISASDMANTVLWVSSQPKHVNINYIELNHIKSNKF